MSVILWAILAVVAGLGFVAVSARRALRLPPPPDLAPGETLPPTVLQRLARRSLAIGLLLVAVAVAAVLRAGADTFYQDDATRLTVTLLMLAALVVLAGFGMRAQGLARKPRSPLDERDVSILDRAPLLEGNAMMVTLALWVVGLQQTFWSAGAVPLVWLYLMMWSLLLLKALVLPMGVLLGYRRS